MINQGAPSTPLKALLTSFRNAAVTEREKGTYFEELIIAYLRNEASYKDLYSHVWTYAHWAKEQGIDARDTGIDLVAQTSGTAEFHAIQCKFYAEEHRVSKADIDSFFTASGKAPFTHRIIVTTTSNWSEHASDALIGQTPPVTKIDLYDLENSQIEWTAYAPKAKPVLREKKRIRDHQKQAVRAVVEGLAEAERGKLIMACGTGKTFTSLKIAEEIGGKGKRVLFLVPSLALLSQSLTEWTQESSVPLHSFAVCSDSEIGNKRGPKEDDRVETFAHELRYPATTDARRLALEMQKRHGAAHMSVVFSTYHSIEVLSHAQKKHKLEDFDLIICDEAHRTTGATFGDEDESTFVKVHDQKFIRAAKRLYMTATPRIYAEIAKASAEKDNITLCSMDDEKLFGKELHVITFSEAVKRDLLVDYKVIVLAVDEAHVSQRLQSLLADENNDVKVDDASKIIGCWKALSKQGTQEHLDSDTGPMKRAVAFCQVIEFKKNAKVHKVASKLIAKMFQSVVEAYEKEEAVENALKCEAEHVDGTMNATEKEEKIRWLKEETRANTCRILSNVRCLSEGVDVPALDAVLFLTPRSSQVDVVQSVGRVMRNAPGKKRGYVILPVVIPAGTEPHDALNDNKTYKVVWQVLQALRSHDDRFDAMINKLELVGPDKSKMEVIAVTDKVPKRREKSKGLTEGKAGRGGFTIGKATPNPAAEDQHALQFEIGEIERAIYARVVQKCGNRRHWEEWANDIAKIANTHIARIQAIVTTPANKKEIQAFQDFADELRDDLNDSITNDEVVEMLAQHLITKPVFDALFSDYKFAKQNPVSLAMDKMLAVLHEHHLEKEADTLQKFYDSVKLRAEGIDNAQGKQKIIIELYDKFFRNAFPKMTERLGIVYTPVEVVDFIIHSVNDLLQKEFGQTLSSKNVHILDPFTGTGTFITRLLQSGLIAPEELTYKYKNEIHANEIVLLAYYIAAINIEATYHSLIGDGYEPFNGICLTDTFQLYEKDDLISRILVDNSDRRNRQKALDIRVIMCNPPYSSGQTSANDNNQNVKYPTLDEQIGKTYAAHSTATLQNSLYDSYIRAIRWASDRIGNSGILGFVTNAGWIEGNAMDGMRKCLAEEFSCLYIFHLRGNQRTAGERSRREGGKIFGSGSRAPIAISLLVKKPGGRETGRIFFHDIGDYLSRDEKLAIIAEFRSIAGLETARGWRSLQPDQHHDWINQRDDRFGQFARIGDRHANGGAIFEIYSGGVKTNRDAWVYNYSRKHLSGSIQEMIQFFNEAIDRVKRSGQNAELSHDPGKISWSANLKGDLLRGRKAKFTRNKITPSVYRPFSKHFLYFDRQLNERVLQVPRMFPDAAAENLVIVTTGIGAKAFSALAMNRIPCYDSMEKSQCFPLYLYDTDDDSHKKAKDAEADLFDSDADNRESSAPKRRYAITDAGLAHFTSAYPGEKITKEDLFHYIYGLLHSPDYRTKYADNLSKELPRIPCVKTAAEFWHFTKAGRQLAELHVNYETVAMHSVKIVAAKILTDKHFYVTQMKYGKAKEEGQRKDLTTILYNEFITITDIPIQAHEYIVNGKSALDWVVERYCVKTDKDSGIVNDANLWATETAKNPKYILELIQRVITVSLETMRIVKGLPPFSAQARPPWAAAPTLIDPTAAAGLDRILTGSEAAAAKGKRESGHSGASHNS